MNPIRVAIDDAANAAPLGAALLAGGLPCAEITFRTAAAADAIVLGIGINVNNRVQLAPAELQDRVTSLSDITGYPFPLVTVLTSVLRQIAEQLRRLRAGHQQLQRQWDAHCMLTGHRVEIVAGPQRTCGVCRGIGRDGALLVETAAGIQPCASGEVLSWQ